ncbi:uroporphyrinogen-III synthase [Robertkochia aurantiaca]|uniref:uroporphyrinogen-III synthase n=1 Tax=Robertkochia aurantiaca TaxID=2873700 RepID=UPI001CCA82E3|nr:uroporphyrinogen-III synthase [Robertkochia sp. 3YJGBD-33]
MPENPRILSTKILSPPQQERLLHAGFSLVQLAFIKVSLSAISEPVRAKHAILTSKNAVKAIQQNRIIVENAYCVGEKTAAMTSSLGIPVKVVAETSKELAGIIAEHYSENKYVYFCGNLRRPDLPQILRKSKVDFDEVTVYHTERVPHEVKGSFDGILFFSPSAVESYAQNNKFGNPVCFSIGPTTSDALKNHTSRIITAKKPSAEHVVLEVLKEFKPNMLKK